MEARSSSLSSRHSSKYNHPENNPFLQPKLDNVFSVSPIMDELYSLRATIEHYKDEMKELEEDVSVYRHNEEVKNRRISNLEAEARQLRALVANMQQSPNPSGSIPQLLQVRIAELEADNRRLQAYNSELESAVGSFQTSLNDLHTVVHSDNKIARDGPAAAPPAAATVPTAAPDANMFPSPQTSSGEGTNSRHQQAQHATMAGAHGMQTMQPPPSRRPQQLQRTTASRNLRPDQARPESVSRYFPPGMPRGTASSPHSRISLGPQIGTAGTVPTRLSTASTSAFSMAGGPARSRYGTNEETFRPSADLSSPMPMPKRRRPWVNNGDEGGMDVDEGDGANRQQW